MATLNLPDSPRVLVWRLVKARLQADAVLAASGVALMFYDGTPDDEEDLQAVEGAALRFYPTNGSQKWFDPSSQSGVLSVAMESNLPTTDAEDVLNLQGAVELALYPADGHAFLQSLVDAGAVTGYCAFDRPLTQPVSTAGANQSMAPSGSFSIEVLKQFNA